jgi:ABC-type branched-subunit amino acid transport system ATPase component/ABC-type branched-subunit amino acid transport system permease subunit
MTTINSTTVIGSKPAYRWPSFSLNRWSLLVFVLALAMPISGDDYFGLIATRGAIYWILVAGLNLVVGYAGQLAIGYVSLLTVGAYTASILAERFGLNAAEVLVAAAVSGTICGAVLGLPALRLKTFYFAMTTFGFATIVTQVALGWTGLTGGGMGVPGPAMPGILGSTWAFYILCLALAAGCTWITTNIAESHFGRALIVLRDAEVAAESNGISKPELLIVIFAFSGALAGVAGGLFASVQTYITPDAFTFDLSLLFFITILVGGQGSILGPLLGTIILTALPEFAAPLASWSTFLYAALLLVIVLVIPGGIAELLDFRNRRPLASSRPIVANSALLPELLKKPEADEGIVVRGIKLSFGSVVAINGLDFHARPGEVHGLIGPNGSGKTTTLNVICGFANPQEGSVTIAGRWLISNAPQTRAANGISRTFQTPRVVGALSVLDNVLIGGTAMVHAGFFSTLLMLPRQRREEASLKASAHLALRTVGLDELAHVRAGRLQHSELRFVEIARALMSQPAFLLLDEPAAGLSMEEISQLGLLIKGVSDCGVGVLLIEHHADFIFGICDRVTVLNLGKTLASGTPEEIRSHREVMSVYLGT